MYRGRWGGCEDEGDHVDEGDCEDKGDCVFLHIL